MCLFSFNPHPMPMRLILLVLVTDEKTGSEMPRDLSKHYQQNERKNQNLNLVLPFFLIIQDLLSQPALPKVTHPTELGLEPKTTGPQPVILIAWWTAILGFSVITTQAVGDCLPLGAQPVSSLQWAQSSQSRLLAHPFCLPYSSGY